MWYWRSNARPAAGSSRMSMPAKRTPRERASPATRARTGASLRQGTHHEPQKLITTVWPRHPAMSRCWPVSVVPEMRGPGGRCTAGMTWPTAGSPAAFGAARRAARRLGVGEAAAGQVIGVDQDLVGEPVGRAVRAEGQLRPDAVAGEPQQQDLPAAAASHQVGHRDDAPGVGLAGEEL